LLIKVLVENTTRKDSQGLKAQHGMSLYLETQGSKVLFDTGQDHFFLDNAQKLGVNLEEVDFLVISHGHYDHGGGLECFLQKNSRSKVFLSRHCLRPFYAQKSSREMKFIGLSSDVFSRHQDRFVFIPAGETFFQIMPNLVLLANTRFDGFIPQGNEILLKKEQDAYRPDDFKHELMLVALEPEGDVVFTGCSHGGVTNMLYSYRDKYPFRPFKALFGGFHLMDPLKGVMREPEDVVLELAEEIGSFYLEQVFTGHCTGEEAFGLLSQKLGSVVQRFCTGDEYLI